MNTYSFYTETEMEGVKYHRIIAYNEIQALELLLESGYGLDEVTRLSMGIDNDDGGCAEYCEFLKNLDKIHKKINDGDLSDFTELNW